MTVPSAAHPHAAANLRGIVAMLVAQGLFVASDTLVKLASEGLPPTQIMAVRGTMAVGLMIALVASLGLVRKLVLAANPLVVLRAALEAAIALLFLIALPFLTLSTITTILQATPLMLTALSAVVLSEQVGWRRWSAVAVGFIGVLLVVQPTSEGVNVYALLALAVAALVAARDLVTRQLNLAIPPALVTLVTTIGVCLIGFAGAPFDVWKPLSGEALLYLAGSAVLVSVANLFMVRAFRGVEMSVVSPFRYVAVVWALMLGFIVWGDVPNSVAMAGTAVIIACGVYTMHREALRRRAAAQAQKPVPEPQAL